jgi:SAM-dependent methyltransferase
MEKDFYLQYADAEDKHWWFLGRRRIINKVIRQLNLPKNIEILEAGCCTGGNLAMLARHGSVSAMELDQIACKIACDRVAAPLEHRAASPLENRPVAKVRLGSLPDNIPFNGEYDLIVILDVIEHLDDDLAGLKALYSQLKLGGYLLITVPAYQFLWSHHDDINHHKRRYLLKGLKQVVRKAGFTVRYGSYINTFLFPIVALVRGFKNILNFQEKNTTSSSDLILPSPPVNKLLTYLFASERHLIGKVSLPFGVSALLVAQKGS